LPSAFKFCFRSAGWKILAGLFLSVFAVAQMRAADWGAKSAPEYDRLFQRTNGWIGADGDFTVSLTNKLTLWLFSDTFIGDVRDDQRTTIPRRGNRAIIRPTLT